MLVFIQTIKFVHWGLLHLMFLDSLLADLSDNPIVFFLHIKQGLEERSFPVSNDKHRWT